MLDSHRKGYADIDTASRVPEAIYRDFTLSSANRAAEFADGRRFCRAVAARWLAPEIAGLPCDGEP
jgi:hypothetical protein